MLDTARKSLGLAGQSPRRFAVPVEPLRMARPEGLWVLEGLFKCLSLGMWRHCWVGVYCAHFGEAYVLEGMGWTRVASL